MGWISFIAIAALILIVLGLGITGTFEAMQAGWDKIPAQNITDNFREAAEKSAMEIVEEIDP